MVAKVDTENVASQRLAIIAGGKKGSLCKGQFTRSDGTKGDSQSWYLDRTGYNPETAEKQGEGEEGKEAKSETTME